MITLWDITGISPGVLVYIGLIYALSLWIDWMEGIK